MLTLFVGSAAAVNAGPEQQSAKAEACKALRWLAQMQAGDSQKEPDKKPARAKAVTALAWLAQMQAADFAEGQAVQIRAIRISGGVVEIRGNVIRSDGGRVEIILEGRSK